MNLLVLLALLSSPFFADRARADSGQPDQPEDRVETPTRETVYVKLSKEALQKAKAFISDQGRDVERQLLAYYFDGGPRSAVLEALAHYQNQDGGFGRGFEPDLYMAGSSVYTTTMALRVLGEVGATSQDEIVRKAMQYLLDQYDPASGVWPIVPAAVDAAPHAPWWNFEDVAQNFNNCLANPRAEVLGYLYTYPELATIDVEPLTQAVLDHLATLPDEMNLYDLICYIRLAETPALPQPAQDRLAETLRKRAPHVVAKTPEALSQPSAHPLLLATTPASILAATLKDEIDMNLDFVIEHQNPDGSWSPPWTWYGQYPDHWQTAERDWKSFLTVEILKALKEFGRIDGLQE